MSSSRTWRTAADLRARPELSVARELLASWRAPDDAQARERDRIVAWIDRFPTDAHLRTRLEGHLTASAWIVDASGTRALLTHHKKLNRWLQLGGHCDGDANLAHVSLREAIEESGIAGLTIDPTPIDVDVHTIPARANEPEHFHLDTRFLVTAPRGAEIVVSDESHALAWLTPDELRERGVDESVMRLSRAVFGR